jgi:hypothetical protein
VRVYFISSPSFLFLASFPLPSLLSFSSSNSHTLLIKQRRTRRRRRRESGVLQQQQTNKQTKQKKTKKKKKKQKKRIPQLSVVVQFTSIPISTHPFAGHHSHGRPMSMHKLQSVIVELFQNIYINIKIKINKKLKMMSEWRPKGHGTREGRGEEGRGKKREEEGNGKWEEEERGRKRRENRMREREYQRLGHEVKTSSPQMVESML